MSDVTKLPIYKSLLPRIRKQDRAEFKRMLQLACDEYRPGPAWKGHAFGRCPYLSVAFYWDGTPQGSAYWSKLFGRLYRGGHKDVA